MKILVEEGGRIFLWALEITDLLLLLFLLPPTYSTTPCHLPLVILIIVSNINNRLYWIFSIFLNGLL